jgi:hypothetical protein
MPTLTEFCQIEAKLKFTPIGGTGTGFRVDNSAVAVALGGVDGNKLSLTVSLISA